MSEEKIESRWFDGEEYFNVTNAARYIGLSGTGMRNLIKRLKDTEEAIPVHEIPHTRDKYIKKSDLDNFRKPRRVRLED